MKQASEHFNNIQQLTKVLCGNIILLLAFYNFIFKIERTISQLNSNWITGRRKLSLSNVNLLNELYRVVHFIYFAWIFTDGSFYLFIDLANEEETKRIRRRKHAEAINNFF